MVREQVTVMARISWRMMQFFISPCLIGSSLLLEFKSLPVAASALTGSDLNSSRRLDPIRQGLMKNCIILQLILAITVTCSRTIAGDAQVYNFTTIAGLAGTSGSADGINSAARF